MTTNQGERTTLKLLSVAALLAFTSIFVTAHTMSAIFSFFNYTANVYVAWISGAAMSAMVILFPIGLFLDLPRPLVFGFAAGLAASIFLAIYGGLIGVGVSTGFLLEYFSMILFGGIFCSLGQRTKTALGWR